MSQTSGQARPAVHSYRPSHHVDDHRRARRFALRLRHRRDLRRDRFDQAEFRRAAGSRRRRAQLSLEGLHHRRRAVAVASSAAPRRRHCALPRTSRRPASSPACCSSSRHWAPPAWPESWLGSSGFGADAADQCPDLVPESVLRGRALHLKFGDVITNFIGHRLFGGMGIGLGSMLAPDVHRRNRAAVQARRAGYLPADRDRQRHHGARTS